MTPEHPWLAAMLDTLMAPLMPARELVVPEARGCVLEVGVGTGLNFGLYRDIERLVGIEPDPHMLGRAQARAETLTFPTELHQVGAERLPFADGSFDTAVITFTLCTIPDVEAALAETRRVLKPGGTLLFAEHVRARGAIAAALQDAATPLWKQIGGGCHLNRASIDQVRAHGFSVMHEAPFGRETLTLLPVTYGRAQAPA